MKAFGKNASSAIPLNNQAGEFVMLTADVKQSCLLLPVLFNLYLENIMQVTEKHHTPIYYGGHTLCNLRLVDFMVGGNQGLKRLTDNRPTDRNCRRIWPVGECGLEKNDDEQHLSTLEQTPP